MSGPSKFANMPGSARLVVAVFGLLGAIELLAALGTRPAASGGVFFLLLGLAVVTSRTKLTLLRGSTLSFLTSVVLMTLMWLGTEAAVVVAMVGVVVQSSFPWKKKVPYRTVFNMGMVGTTVTLAGWGYHAIMPAEPGINDQLAAILFASFIYYVCNSIFVSLIVSLSSGSSISKIWHGSFLYTAPAFFLEGLISFGALKLASVIQFGFVAAAVPVIGLTYYSMRVYLDSLEKEKKHAAEMVALNETLERRVIERSESLRIAKELAEQASRAKSAFLANMSHELRTPLNAIIGYSEMLYEDSVAAGHEEPVSDLLRIRTAGKHLLSLINDLLDLSKIEAGRIELHLSSFDLADVLNEISSTIQPLANKNRNRLLIVAEESVPMISDRTKLCQVLINVSSNACKFTEAGTIALKVRRQTGDGGDFVLIEILDTGIGIEPELLERLFEPFVQADSSTTRKFGGTGLGLAISRKFCQLLGGEITVESAPGRGSEFKITLPVDISPDESALSDSDAGKSGKVLIGA